MSIARRQLAASSSRANAIPLENTVNYAAGTYGTSNMGYFTGGRQTETNPNWESIVDRIDYSNDTATAVAKGSLATRTQRNSAVSSGTHGYAMGGENPASSPSNLSLVQRIDYLNDTATASPKGPLSVARQYVAATGNKDFGYTVGGSPGPTRVDRIDYANDTADAPARGNLASPSVYHGATGNQDFGYTAGGHSGSAVSTITRIVMLVIMHNQ